MRFKKVVPLAIGFTLLSSAVATPIESIFTEHNTDRVVLAASIKKQNYLGTVTADLLNVRKSSSTKTKIIGKLKRNTKVKVVGSVPGWLKINYGKSYKSTGWVSSKYVKKVVTPLKTLYKVKVIKDKTAIHTSNSGKAKVIGHLSKNKIVEVVQVKGSWMKIKNGKSHAWIYSKYVTKNLITASKPKPSKPNTTSPIPGAPKPNKYYALPSGSHVYAMDLSKANNIKMSNSFNRSTKENEFKKLATAIGATYSKGSIQLTKISPSSLIPEYDEAVVVVNVYEPNTKNETLEFSYQSPRSLLEPQAEYLMKHILRPYFPKDFKKLAEQYIREGYYQAVENFDKPKKIGSYYIDVAGGAILISKNKPVW